MREVPVYASRFTFYVSRMSLTHTKILVVGLGNPILTDDGVGIHVARAVALQIMKGAWQPGIAPNPQLVIKGCNESTNDELRGQPQVAVNEDSSFAIHNSQFAISVTEASVGGLRLMEMMDGYDRVILIDALYNPEFPPGMVRRMTLDDLRALGPTQHSVSAHDTSLITALETGRQMGLALPDNVVIYAIGVENILDFGEIMTPAVAHAVPNVVAAVLDELRMIAR
ncbi:MAG: hydrogenase maturation protease [Anaerolineae bacterium]|nr:hydrogenase maturation protease [Anaerolineae bacterium]